MKPVFLILLNQIPRQGIGSCHIGHTSVKGQIEHHILRHSRMPVRHQIDHVERSCVMQRGERKTSIQQWSCSVIYYDGAAEVAASTGETVSDFLERISRICAVVQYVSRCNQVVRQIDFVMDLHFIILDLHKCLRGACDAHSIAFASHQYIGVTIELERERRTPHVEDKYCTVVAIRLVRHELLLEYRSGRSAILSLRGAYLLWFTRKHFCWIDCSNRDSTVTGVRFPHCLGRRNESEGTARCLYSCNVPACHPAHPQAVMAQLQQIVHGQKAE